MCGIAGIVHAVESGGVLDHSHMRRMLGMLRHRGPDQFGIYEDTSATLGSARLKIIDLDAGQQPISNEDGSLWVVFNGEIFNYVELRNDLTLRGHAFSTHTDTEVLIHLFEEYGVECVKRLNGQFAFAIWDNAARSLFLARDRLGVRPLFYTRLNRSLLFASEAKALFTHPDLDARLDPVALEQVFVYWSTLPGRTIFDGIHELPPGHFLTYADGQVELRSYWEISFPPAAETVTAGRLSESEYLEEFSELLTDATRVRLRADVPVGAYLSGGLDSSIIASIVANGSASELATFSVSFEDEDFDESGFQQRMARLLGTRHEVVHARHADIARVFPEVVWHTEIPITRTAPAPMFLLSRLVRDSGFKVVLTGEGADEFLAGYDVFKEAAVRRFWARRPQSKLRPMLLRRLYADIAGLAATSTPFITEFFRPGLAEVRSPYYSHLVRWRNNARTRRFLSEHIIQSAARSGGGGLPGLPPAFHTWGALQQSQFLEAGIFLPQYLLSSQGDRMAMANSVETRHPFLDYRLVEFCNRLPSILKLRGLRDKRVLRQMGAKLLPSDIWQRPKRPYRAPIHRSFFGPSTPEYVHEMLSPRRLDSAGLFRSAAVQSLVKKVQSGMALGETDDMALAGILSAQLLHYQFVSDFHPAPPLSDRDDIKIRGGRLAGSGVS
ncbi:MAG TPA: asparagine synthase (glutamine-hydrolyzing) [Bryobacteraceae bacterium]|nr:asparagine synthase (glutamine-hydrolyzing) [Bryobacteraceae bacterium]